MRRVSRCSHHFGAVKLPALREAQFVSEMRLPIPNIKCTNIYRVLFKIDSSLGPPVGKIFDLLTRHGAFPAELEPGRLASGAPQHLVC